MAPPEDKFPVSELPERVHIRSTYQTSKSRKLPVDFDLKKNCELFELVQYSCTTPEEQAERTISGYEGPRMECFPFVRLFRRCNHKGQTFHVETTAWEGRHAWKPSKRLLEESESSTTNTPDSPPATTEGSISSQLANYVSYFWSAK